MDIDKDIEALFIGKRKLWWVDKELGDKIIESYIMIFPEEINHRINNECLRVLDVGSGPHHFLLKMRELGHDIYAVDEYPDETIYEWIEKHGKLSGLSRNYANNVVYKFLAEKYKIKHQSDGAFGKYGENFGFEDKFDLINLRGTYKFLERIEQRDEERDDLIDEFFKNCIDSLKDNGFFIIKTTKARRESILDRFSHIEFKSIRNLLYFKKELVHDEEE